MHFSPTLASFLLSYILATTVTSLPTSAAAIRRRSDDLGFALLGDDADCGNFELDGESTFKALCVDDTGNPVISTVDLSQCILNQGGNLAFLFK
jgi:hypothetical protein